MNVRNIHRLLVTEAPSWLIYVFFFYVYTSLDFFSSTSQIQKIAPTMEFSCKRMHTKLPFSFFFFFLLGEFCFCVVHSCFILFSSCSFLVHSILVSFIHGAIYSWIVRSWLSTLVLSASRFHTSQVFVFGDWRVCRHVMGLLQFSIVGHTLSFSYYPRWTLPNMALTFLSDNSFYCSLVDFLSVQ